VPKEIRLEIGGLRVGLQEPGAHETIHWPAQAYEPFLGAAGPLDLRFGVCVCSTLPDTPKGRPLYRAEDGSWSLFERLEGFLIETLEPRSGKPYNRALISPDYSCATIFTRGEEGKVWNPSKLINPVVEICLLTRLAREGALMLHAAGVDWRGDGLVFTGPSGAGKSTLSGMFVARGAMILNDERIIVTDGPAGPVVHGTPWCGSNPIMNNAKAPLREVRFIRHGRDAHRLRPLRPAEAVSLCVRQAFLPFWDEEAMAQTMSSAERLMARVDASEFSFLNEPSAVDFLLERRGDAVLEKLS
jgi:hypothetical protein